MGFAEHIHLFQRDFSFRGHSSEPSTYPELRAALASLVGQGGSFRTEVPFHGKRLDLAIASPEDEEVSGLIEVKRKGELTKGAFLNQTEDYVSRASRLWWVAEADPEIIQWKVLEDGGVWSEIQVYEWGTLVNNPEPLREALQRAVDFEYLQFTRGALEPKTRHPGEHPKEFAKCYKEISGLVSSALRDNGVGLAYGVGLVKGGARQVCFEESTGSRERDDFLGYLSARFLSALVLVRHAQCTGDYVLSFTDHMRTKWAHRYLKQSVTESIEKALGTLCVAEGRTGKDRYTLEPDLAFETPSEDPPSKDPSDPDVGLVLKEVPEETLTKVLYKLAQWDITQLGRDLPKVSPYIDLKWDCPEGLAVQLAEDAQLSPRCKYIADACCGSGAVLSQMIRKILEVYQPQGLSEKVILEVCSRFWGLDVDPTNFALVRLRLIDVLLEAQSGRGPENLRIARKGAWAVTLSTARLMTKRFDRVVMVPHARRSHQRKKRHGYGTPKGHRNEAVDSALFACGLVKPTRGLALICLPEQILGSKSTKSSLDLLLKGASKSVGRHKVFEYRVAAPSGKAVQKRSSSVEVLRHRVQSAMTPMNRHYEVGQGLELGNKKATGTQLGTLRSERGLPISILQGEDIVRGAVRPSTRFLNEKRCVDGVYSWAKSSSFHPSFDRVGPEESIRLLREIVDVQHILAVRKVSPLLIAEPLGWNGEGLLPFGVSSVCFLGPRLHRGFVREDLEDHPLHLLSEDKGTPTDYPFHLEVLSRLFQAAVSEVAPCNLPEGWRPGARSWDVRCLRNEVGYLDLNPEDLWKHGGPLRETLRSITCWESRVESLLSSTLMDELGDLQGSDPVEKIGRVKVTKRDARLAQFMRTYQELTGHVFTLDSRVPPSENLSKALAEMDFDKKRADAEGRLLEHDHHIGRCLNFCESDVQALIETQPYTVIDEAIEEAKKRRR